MIDGLTLLDFSGIGPGPRCSRLLADHGMRVVKVRPPSGDDRMMRAPWYSYSADRGIPQIHVDLKTDGGRELVHRLIGRVDAVLESFRPTVAARLGVGHDTARALNGSLVYCSVSGYGQTGPYAQWPAHDLNWLALTGFVDGGSRRSDGSPALPGAAVADALGGYSASVAVLSALLRRQVTGEGAYLDVAVTDSALRLMQVVLDGRLAEQSSHETVQSPVDDVLTGGAACYDFYQAGDGRWLAVGAVEPHFWAALCAGLGLGHRIADQFDPARQDELRAELRAAFARRDREEWVRELGPVACVTPVNTPSEALLDPHLNSRPLTVEVRIDGHPVRQLMPRLAVEDPVDLADHHAGASTWAQVEGVLVDLGVDSAEVAALREAGVLTV